MTKEEAIVHIKDVICENNTIKPNIAIFEQEKEALYMAIKALKQEPYEDCINTEPKKVDEWDICGKPAELWVVNGQIQIRHRGTIHNVSLPSIQPKPKTGHWEQSGYSWLDKFKCSECGEEQPKILCGERIIGHWSDYCPNCGAKMDG